MKVLLNEVSKLVDAEGFVLPYFEEMTEGYSIAIKQHEKKVPVEFLKEKELFTGKKNSGYSMNFSAPDQVIQLELVGLGESGKSDSNSVRKSIAKAVKSLKGKKVETINILLNKVDCDFDLIRVVAESAMLADYKFQNYKSEPKESSIKEVRLVVETIDGDAQASLAEGIVLANSEIIARDLTNEPANTMYPEVLADKAKALGKEKGFEVEVFKQSKIEKLGMKAFMAVAKASTNEPKFIIMRYVGNPGGETIGLVGKGLTYDAGGLSIKSTKGMSTMKCDMGGASGVIGAMAAIAENKLKVNVTTVVAACENMIAGNSYKPGDIIGSMAGKTIFIGNTDAEGRLTLIDAVHYIIENEKVDKVLDMATLTGAAIHCTGTVATVAVTNDKSFYEAVQKGFDNADNKIWEMPMFEEYKETLKHHEADLTNIPGSPGTITAGMFIGEFVQDKPWVHLDIAGTAWTEKDSDVYSKGGTGVGARALYFMAKGLQ